MRVSTILPTALLLAMVTSACARPRRPGTQDATCTVSGSAALPTLLRETSGLAASRRQPGILWTHDDSGGEPVVYALDRAGRLLGAVRVTGARNVDWEDIALGPCPSGDCLYIGDIGDNAAARPMVEIYRVAEPRAGDAATAPAERMLLTYTDGPRDAEALYVLPDMSVFLVSKGRKGPVAVYRVPGNLRAGAPGRLERVQVLSPNGSEVGGLVTGADATADGKWVAIRTYEVVRFYPVSADGRLGPALSGEGISLGAAREPQGEGIALGRADTIWLTSEAGVLGGHATLSALRCSWATRRP